VAFAGAMALKRTIVPAHAGPSAPAVAAPASPPVHVPLLAEAIPELRAKPIHKHKPVVTRQQAAASPATAIGPGPRTPPAAANPVAQPPAAVPPPPPPPAAHPPPAPSSGGSTSGHIDP
jgi:hypothetical protein